MIEFFANYAFAQMVMCALLLLPNRKQNPSISLFILLLLCSCGYLLDSILDPIEPMSIVWWFVRVSGNALPGVFWLVSLSIFSDHNILKLWQYLVASLTLLVPLSKLIIETAFDISFINYPILYGVVTYGALILELVLISYALVIAAQHWRDDLVQERRYIRGGVITVSALYIILVIVFEQLLNVGWSSINTITSFLLALLISGINYLLFQIKPLSLFETVNDHHSIIISKSPESKRAKELVKIVESMEQDKLYQQDGLTISGLAKHLAIQEYKLRNLINVELNYRNFNDFLNFYRIKEVAENLVLPKSSHLPVLTLALDSGFRSLSSFNKAFKNTYGITPTNYRKKNMSKL